jgi:hypothetical protein
MQTLQQRFEDEKEVLAALDAAAAEHALLPRKAAAAFSRARRFPPRLAASETEDPDIEVRDATLVHADHRPFQTLNCFSLQHVVLTQIFVPFDDCCCLEHKSFYQICVNGHERATVLKWKYQLCLAGEVMCVLCAGPEAAQ